MPKPTYTQKNDDGTEETGTLEGDSFGPNFNVRTVGSKIFPLKADETAATSDTNVVTVTQAGIKYADLANPHKTITMYVWFGADPAAGSQIPLVPGASWSGPVDNKADMRYKSSAAGGVLDYVLRG